MAGGAGSVITSSAMLDNFNVSGVLDIILLGGLLTMFTAIIGVVSVKLDIRLALIMVFSAGPFGSFGVCPAHILFCLCVILVDRRACPWLQLASCYGDSFERG